MGQISEISALQRFKREVDDDWQKAFGHFNFLQEKMQQIDQIIGGKQETTDDITFDTEEAQADLVLIKSILIQFNALCKNRRNDFTTSKVPIDDNKWMHYPQYPIPDFTTCMAGSRLKGAISYIKDPNEGIFYLMDFGRSAKDEFSVAYQFLQKKIDLKRITNLSTLESGDLIALQLDDAITRVLVEVTTDSFTFFLIDSGEEIQYDENMELFEMAKDYRNLPALAILCKCENSSSKYMRKHLHKEVKLEVFKVKYNTVYVKFEDPLIVSDTSKISEATKAKQEPNNNNKKFTGSGNAYAKKNTLSSAKPLSTGIGMLLMQKMGWSPGEGLGKDKSGTLTPLLLDVKVNRRGLGAENLKKKRPLDITDKHPVCILNELAAKNKWGVPRFEFTKQGPHFVGRVVVNEKEYQPQTAQKSQKEAKKEAAKYCCQQLGVL